MLIKDEKFRKLYGSLILLKSKIHVQKQRNNFKSAEKFNSILLYPYIDHDEGMSFLVVAPALVNNKRVKLFNRDNFNVSNIIRKKDINDEEFIYLDDCKITNNFDMSKHKKYIHKSTKIFFDNEEREVIRMVRSLDELRNEDFPDDVLVLFLGDYLIPERLWVRLEKFDDGFFRGILLNQPRKDLGINKGDYVNVFLRKNEDDKIVCFAKWDT